MAKKPLGDGGRNSEGWRQRKKKWWGQKMLSAPLLTPAEKKILVLLPASAERFNVFRMRDFKKCLKMYDLNIPRQLVAEVLSSHWVLFRTQRQIENCNNAMIYTCKIMIICSHMPEFHIHVFLTRQDKKGIAIVNHFK